MDRYQGLSISVCGSGHTEQHALLGDYSLIHEDEGFWAMAVSAGGNDSQYFRSYLGARFAAEAALESMIAFASFVTKEMLFSDERTQARMIRQLEGSVIIGWRKRVCEHLGNYPFQQGEICSVEDEKYRKGYQEGIDQEYAYRSNVMGAVVTKEYCLVIRNGNGECTIIGDNWKLEEPVTWNEKCRNGRTTSMCERTAIQEFRYYCSDVVPAAVFLVTDGMRCCFEKPESYHAYMKQLAQRLLMNMADTKTYLKGDLSELSRSGSHGDMCFAGVWAADILGIVQEPESEPEPVQKPERVQKPVPVLRSCYWMAAVAVAAAAMLLFFKGSRDSGRQKMETAGRTEAEISLEDKLETEEETEDLEAESKAKAELEASIRESLREEMASEVTEEITTEVLKAAEPEPETETSTEPETSAPQTTASRRTEAAPRRTEAPPPPQTETPPPPPTEESPVLAVIEVGGWKSREVEPSVVSGQDKPSLPPTEAPTEAPPPPPPPSQTQIPPTSSTIEAGERKSREVEQPVVSGQEELDAAFQMLQPVH